MNTAKYFWPILWLALAPTLSAQNYVIANDIPVLAGANSLRMAWTGGLTAPQISAIDLDNDGLQDLVIFERDGDAVIPLLNGGTAGQVDYDYMPQFIQHFPEAVTEWALMRDFDGDGKMDIFTAISQINGVRVFRNTSANTGGTLSFGVYQDTVRSNYPPNLPLFSSRSDLPAIDDIDGDGDLDLLTFQLSGTKVEFHKNLSVENTGGLGQVLYKRQSRCFGHFEEDQFGCFAEIGRVPCGTGERDADVELVDEKIAVHAGSTILSLDLDNNGLKDLVIGDIGCSTVYGLYNAGTTAIANFDSNEVDFPASDNAARVLIFPASYFVDVDNDGKNDLIIAPNKADQVEDRRSIQFFKNAGSNVLPDFQDQGYGLLQNQMIDMGTKSMPAFIDHNADGLQDLLIGGAGRFDSLIGFVPLLQLYTNTGTAQQPTFTLTSANYLNLAANGAFANADHLQPTAGDLDGDGDQDLLLGNIDGAIFHFTNTAGPGNAAMFNLQTANFAGIDVGLNSTPQLVDLDQDSDLDLLVGNHRGYIAYYQNTGTSSQATFIKVTDSLGHVKINDAFGQWGSNGFAQPQACDYDGDGDLDLLVGTFEGEIQVYENISLAPGAVFTRSGDLIGENFGSCATIASAVLDSSILSFVIGNHRGGVMLLRDSGPVNVANASENLSPTIKLFPNPASDRATYEIAATGNASPDQYALYDVWGRLITQGKLQGKKGDLDVSDLPNGLYLVVFRGRGPATTQRLVVAH